MWPPMAVPFLERLLLQRLRPLRHRHQRHPLHRHAPLCQLRLLRRPRARRQYRAPHRLRLLLLQQRRQPLLWFPLRLRQCRPW